MCNDGDKAPSLPFADIAEFKGCNGLPFFKGIRNEYWVHIKARSTAKWGEGSSSSRE